MARAAATAGGGWRRMGLFVRRILEIGMLSAIWWRSNQYVVTTLAGTRGAVTIQRPQELGTCRAMLERTLDDQVDVARLWQEHSGVTSSHVEGNDIDSELSYSPYTCKCRQSRVHQGSRPLVTAIVQSFNHKMNVENISSSLHSSVDEIVVCEDGSSDGALAKWASVLTRADDLLIRSNNLHEMRAYNRALRVSDGEFILLLQDDDLLPTSSQWLEDAIRLMRSYPQMGILGGYIGQLWTHEPYRGYEFGEETSTHGGVRSGNTRKIPYLDPITGLPFMFVECAWIAPVLIRRSLIERAGGLNLDIARRGEPGVWQDCVYSMEAWVHGFQVGIFHASFTRGVGGHGSATTPEKLRMRERVFNRALALANRRYKRRHLHNLVVGENERLLRRRDPAQA